MDPKDLARDNHLFFYTQLPPDCLLTENFLGMLDAGARAAAHFAKYSKWPGREDTWHQQISFLCNNGEMGYLKLSNNDAQLLAENHVDVNILCWRIPRNIGGELNDTCEVSLGPEWPLTVLFKITLYEGDLGNGCVQINDPVVECPEPIPLGRLVEMTVMLKP